MKVIHARHPVQLVRYPGHEVGEPRSVFAVRVIGTTEVTEVFRSFKHRTAREQFDIECHFRCPRQEVA